MKDFRFEILKHIATLSDDGKYRVELNLMRFNDGAAKYDLRRWRDKDNQMLKGIGLTDDELETLRIALAGLKIDGAEDHEQE